MHVFDLNNTWRKASEAGRHAFPFLVAGHLVGLSEEGDLFALH